MGLIICPTHGESGFSMRFSKKVIDSINADKVLRDNDLTIFRITLLDDEDGEILFSEDYLLFYTEFLSMKVPNEVEVDSEADYDFFYSKLPELDGICFGCLQDYKRRHNLPLLEFN